MPCFLIRIYVYYSFLAFLGAPGRRPRALTKLRALFVEWAKKNKGRAGFDALSSCIMSFSEHDGKVLLRHVTKGYKSDWEFLTRPSLSVEPKRAKKTNTGESNTKGRLKQKEKRWHH
jgi:hypothetical protein